MNRSSVPLPRALVRSSARLGTVVLVGLTALAASISVAAVASAHVSVSSQDAAPGGYGKLTFRVPNESDAASTVGLRIQIPEEAAMASVRTQAVPGWTATLTTSDLATPLKSHGQEISSYASVVEYPRHRRRYRAGAVPGVRALGRAVPGGRRAVVPHGADLQRR
jgi:periplasmic copper chaperone A